MEAIGAMTNMGWVLVGVAALSGCTSLREQPVGNPDVHEESVVDAADVDRVDVVTSSDVPDARDAADADAADVDAADADVPDAPAALTLQAGFVGSAVGQREGAIELRGVMTWQGVARGSEGGITLEGRFQ